ncbi:MAG: hypothetical protein RI930_204 [Pseudomonadota bacterium]|jgi:hypothetical protein
MHKQEKRFDLEKQLLSQTALCLKIASIKLTISTSTIKLLEYRFIRIDLVNNWVEAAIAAFTIGKRSGL